MLSPLASRLLNWYALHARNLPWRSHPEPYTVLIAEIMLQQTRVETVLPYFERWMEHFPNIQVLAEADLQQVLNLWEGLGYYSRARNLHQTARIIVEEFEGRLPKSSRELRKLPGIGRYTAGAISSIAFGQDEPALDGNVRRILARVFNLELPDRSSAGERFLWAKAEAHLPAGRAGEYNQAWMDLGAAVCTPRNPDCDVCPLNDLCVAYALGIQEERPVRFAKVQTPHYIVTAAIISRNGQVLIAQRPETGLLGGLWEFPGGKKEQNESLSAALKREIQEELAVEIEIVSELGVFRHAYSHFQITLHAFYCSLQSGFKPQAIEHSSIAWVPVAQLDTYPMGKVDRQIATFLSQQRKK